MSVIFDSVPSEFTEEYNNYFDLAYLRNKYKIIKTGFTLKYARDNPVTFAYFMLGKKVRPYQAFIIKKMLDEPKFAMCLARRLGKSTMIALVAFWLTYFNFEPMNAFRNYTQIGIISKEAEAAKMILRMIRDLIIDGDAHMSKLLSREGSSDKTRNYFSSYLIEPNNSEQITWANRSNVKSLPPTKKVRGFGFSRVFNDELAFTVPTDDPDIYTFYYGSVRPTISDTGGKECVSSTPNGRENLFYDLLDPEGTKDSEFVGVMFDWTINKDDPVYYNMVMETKKSMENQGRSVLFRQEYCNDFSAVQNNFYSVDDLDKYFDKQYGSVWEWKKTPCSVGIDFGVSFCKTAITVKTKHKGFIRTLYHREFPVGFDNNELLNRYADDSIYGLMKRYDVAWIIPDDCLEENTEVLMHDYSRKKIKDVKVGDLVWSYDFGGKKYVIKPVVGKYDKGMRKVNRIFFKNGTSVLATDNHKWFNFKRNYLKYVHIDSTSEIKRKNILRHNKRIIPFAYDLPNNNDLSLPDNVAFILGVYIAEGHKRPTKKSFFISQLDKDNCKILKNVLDKTGFVWQKNGKGFYLSDIGEYYDLFKDCGTCCYDKKIPEEVFSYSKKTMNKIYDGLIFGDGSVMLEKVYGGKKSSKKEIYYTSSNQLIKDMRFLSMLINKPMHYREGVRSGFGSKRIQYTGTFNENAYFTKIIEGHKCSKLFIRGIDTVGFKHVYDIDVADTHSFILADSGVITHNCDAGVSVISLMKNDGLPVQPYSFRSSSGKNQAFYSHRALMKKGVMKCFPSELLRTQFLCINEEQLTKNVSIGKQSKTQFDDVVDSDCFATVPFFELEESSMSSVDDVPVVPESVGLGRRPYAFDSEWQGLLDVHREQNKE